MHVWLLALTAAMTLAAQDSAEDFKVYTEYPRLLLRQQRLRLLRRERERQSPRWTQLDTLIKGKAQMPDQAFASALYFQVTSDRDSARSAIETALRPDASIRDTALVFDWCQAALSDTQRSQLTEKLQQSLRSPATTFSSARDKAFAAIATGNGAGLQAVVSQWWCKTTAPALMSGTKSIENADFYPFLEFAHAVRDNLQIDIRDDIAPIFRDLSLKRILSYYPATYPAPENEYHIPYYDGKGEPDLRIAALTRAGELALVSFETNAQEMQFLQGWLLRDRFTLRSAFGAPYEFLWANPYQPGLPFDKLPLWLHDERTGTLLMRSSWEDDATWLGVFAGSIQLFREGQIRQAALKDPLEVGDAMVMAGSAAAREFRVAATAPQHWFLLDLKPVSAYDIEIDDEEMSDLVTDRTGIAELKFPTRTGQAVYIHVPRQGVDSR